MNKFTENQLKWLKVMETSTKAIESLTDGIGNYCCLGAACIAMGKRMKDRIFEFSHGNTSTSNYLDYRELNLINKHGRFRYAHSSAYIDLVSLNDDTAITHKGIRKLMIDYPSLMFDNFDESKEKPEIDFEYYIRYDKVEPIPEDLL